MSKMSVSDAAAHFGVSKEAIHNRIRRGSLEVVVENGIKMVTISTKATPAKNKVRVSARSSVHDDRYYKLLEEQNAKLQSRVEVLEGETRTLRDQKELMLIEERKKIENIYKEKDEQLKNILSTLSSQFMLSAPKSIQEETLEVEIEDNDDVDSLISLKKYLKTTSFSEKKREKIKAKFKKRAKKDERIITIGSKCYLNPTKYDYSDLV